MGGRRVLSGNGTRRRLFLHGVGARRGVQWPNKARRPAAPFPATHRRIVYGTGSGAYRAAASRGLGSRECCVHAEGALPRRASGSAHGSQGWFPLPERRLAAGHHAAVTARPTRPDQARRLPANQRRPGDHYAALFAYNHAEWYDAAIVTTAAAYRGGAVLRDSADRAYPDPTCGPAQQADRLTGCLNRRDDRSPAHDRGQPAAPRSLHRHGRRQSGRPIRVVCACRSLRPHPIGRDLGRDRPLRRFWNRQLSHASVDAGSR